MQRKIEKKKTQKKKKKVKKKEKTEHKMNGRHRRFHADYDKNKHKGAMREKKGQKSKCNEERHKSGEASRLQS